jgi:nucleoside-diphosphate-sugar epimerase
MQVGSAPGRVAITGGNGFIGSCLIRRLLSDGFTCWAVVPEGNSTQRLDDLVPAVQVVRFSTPGELGPVIAALAPDFVFHMGAIVSNGRTLDGFHSTLQWNLLSTLSLYEALCGSALRRLVQIGSCEEYGRQPAPFSESSALDPVSPYSASKAAISCYARMFYNCFALPVVVLRPSVIYGPGQDPKMLIPEVITALLDGRSVDTTEGGQTRDFLYVDDFVQALIQAAMLPGIEGEIFNIGSGSPVTVRSCIELIEELTGRSGMVKFGGRAYSSSEIWEYAPALDRARVSLAWQARTSLQQGLRLTIAAFESALSSPTRSSQENRE